MRIIVLILFISLFPNFIYSQSENLSKKASIIEFNKDSLPVIEFKQKVIKNLKPVVTSVQTKHYIKNIPKIKLSKPDICIPGKGKYLPPVISKPNSDKYLAPVIIKPGKPKIVAALTPNHKDYATADIKFIDIEQGLNSSYINCIYEDKFGRIWIGTSFGGLSIYDGKSFRIYNEKQGLPGNDIISIIGDLENNIWIAMKEGGIIKYDGKVFIHYANNQGLKFKLIETIIVDNKNNIWIGTYGDGLFKFNGQEFVQFTVNQGLPSNLIKSLMCDRNGNIWIGTKNGGVSCFDGYKFINYSKKQGLSNNNIYTLYENINGKILIGTYGGGVNILDGDSISIISTKEGLSNDYVWSITEDRFNNYWFSTNGGGINCYKEKQITYFTKENGLTGNEIENSLIDKNGNIWFGSWGAGVNIYKGGLFSHYTEKTGYTNDVVYSIAQDENNLWFGTYNGDVIKYDGQKFWKYNLIHDLQYNVIYSMAAEKTGAIWVGTYGNGFIKYTNGRFVQYINSSDKTDYIIYTIFIDSKENVWFGTKHYGIIIYNGKTFKNLNTDNGLCCNDIRAITEDDNSNIWVGTICGLMKINDNTITNFTKNEGLNENKIISLINDKNGNIWIGTYGGGINCYDGNNFYVFDETQGLLNNIVWSLLEDKQGNIWCGTEKGITKFIKKTDVSDIERKETNTKYFFNKFDIKTYSYLEGLTGNDCMPGAIFEDHNENIWIGTGKHLTKYNPDFDVEDTIKPKIYIKNLRLFFENIDWQDSIYLEHEKIKLDSTTKWYVLPVNLILPYNKNHISFDFIAISWKNPEKLQYQFMLNGHDKKWNPLTYNNEATYSNIEPGKYTFRVKAMNVDNYWSEEASYSFTILPPWWKTTFFKFASIISILIMLFAFYKWRLNSLRLRQKELEKQVQERTFEISEKNKELNIRNEQIALQKKEIETSHGKILESLKYASYIQKILMPSKHVFNKMFKDYFVFFKPRDIVSGDFYWTKQINDNIIIAAADCTGHGVPAALLSMLGIAFLNESVRKQEVQSPADLLEDLRNEIKLSLKHSDKIAGLKDGLDIAICVINKKTNKIYYAGANNPVYIIQNDEVIELKATDNPIGIYIMEKPFVNHEINIIDDTYLYMFTDGYRDQFGGKNKNKFYSTNFKQLIFENHKKPMAEQKKILKNTFNKWKGNNFQIDDVLVVGIKL